jgi:hypothetical protein
MGLHLIVAHQNLSQLSDRLQGAVLGNVWTKVIFGISEEDAYTFARWIGLGEVDPVAIKHDAPTETQHPVYQPLAEQYLDVAAQLANQRPRQATVRDHRGYTQAIWTLPVVDPAEVTPVAQFLDASRWGIPYAQAQTHVEQRLHQTVTAPDPVLFYEQ